MTETPDGPGRSWSDEPDAAPEELAGGEPPAGEARYDEWLAAEDQLLDESASDPAGQSEPEPEPSEGTTDEATEAPGVEPATEEPATEEPAVVEPDAEEAGPEGDAAELEPAAQLPAEPAAEAPEAPEAPAEDPTADGAAAVDVPGGGGAAPEPADATEPVDMTKRPATEPAGAEVPPVDEAPPAITVEPAEPASPDPSPAVAAAPLLDPVAGAAAPDPAALAAQEPAAHAGVLSSDEDVAVPAFRSATALLASLVAAVVVLAALTAFLAVRSASTRGGGSAEDDRREALAASRTAARLVFSYDYRHLGKDFEAGKAVTTGSFRTQYERSTGKLVDETAAKYKAVVSADIGEAAVVCRGLVVTAEPTDAQDRLSKTPPCVDHQSSDEKDAGYRRERGVVTLLFINQTSTSTLNSGSRITQSRLEMSMVRRDGRWLVARIHAF